MAIRKKFLVLAAFFLASACWIFVFARAAVAPVPPSGRALSPAERQAVGRAIARREPAWERQVRLHFPGDDWSQDDDFHALELQSARREAARYGVSAGEVLRAIDEELRARNGEQPGRRRGAARCKPRPFYD